MKHFEPIAWNVMCAADDSSFERSKTLAAICRVSMNVGDAAI
jgi:hypothetical protein